MVLNLIVAKKFTELLLFEVRCKKRDGAGGAAAAGAAAAAAAGSTLYLLWMDFALLTSTMCSGDWADST